MKIQKNNGWCCDKLKKVYTLIIDSQDIDELYHGKCPYCKKIAQIGKERPKGRILTMEKLLTDVNFL